MRQHLAVNRHIWISMQPRKPHPSQGSFQGTTLSNFLPEDWDPSSSPQRPPSHQPNIPPAALHEQKNMGAWTSMSNPKFSPCSQQIFGKGPLSLPQNPEPSTQLFELGLAVPGQHGLAVKVLLGRRPSQLHSSCPDGIMSDQWMVSVAPTPLTPSGPHELARRWSSDHRSSPRAVATMGPSFSTASGAISLGSGSRRSNLV